MNKGILIPYSHLLLSMAVYLDTLDVLNCSVSCFANYSTAGNPRPVNMLHWLRSDKYVHQQQAIRAMPTKKDRDDAKQFLPAITPSGEFTYRSEKKLVRHSGLIQFDIDLKENRTIRNYADLKGIIGKLPFVAYCGLSCSGTGYWGLIPIANPERHGQHFDALYRVFAHYKIKLDDKPRNVASLRGYSYDNNAYFAQRVMLFELHDVPPPAPVRQATFTADADTERKRVEACIAEVVRHGFYVGASYDEWYSVGCSLANAFGENGRDYFHLVSQHYPSYQTAQTDKQYSACLRANSKATLGSFFALCQQLGVVYKDLLKPENHITPRRPQPPPPKPAATVTPELAPPPAPTPVEPDATAPIDIGAIELQRPSIADEPPVPTIHCWVEIPDSGMVRLAPDQIEYLPVNQPPITPIAEEPPVNSPEHHLLIRGIIHDAERMNRLFWHYWVRPPFMWNRIKTHRQVLGWLGQLPP